MGYFNNGSIPGFEGVGEIGGGEGIKRKENGRMINVIKLVWDENKKALVKDHQGSNELRGGDMIKTYVINSVQEAFAFIEENGHLMDIGQIKPKIRNQLNRLTANRKLIFQTKEQFAGYGPQKTVYYLR